MRRLFTDHPASVNESYIEHMLAAGGFAGYLMLAGLACLVHAVLPFAFEKTGSRMISSLHGRMVANRIRHAQVGQPLPSPGD